jgi:hypothetical protein
VAVLRRGVPVGLAVTAALADIASAPALAFYALVVAVPFAAVAALEAYGELVDAAEAARERRYDRLQAILAGAAIAFLVLGAATRAPALGEGVVPTFASSTLVGCLLALLAQALVAGAVQIRNPARAPEAG